MREVKMPCQHIVIYEADEGPAKTLDYPGTMWSSEMGDIVRIEVAGIPMRPGDEERLGDRDWPYLEFDLSVGAARRLAAELVADADRVEEQDGERGA